MRRMRLKTTTVPSKSVSVYMEDVEDVDRDEIAGMLRGLACAIDGFRADSKMTNDRFWQESPVIWPFTTVEKAEYFKVCVDYYFDDAILEALKVKRRKMRR